MEGTGTGELVFVMLDCSMTSCHVACLPGLSEAAHGLKLGDFNVILCFFGRISSEGRKEMRASPNLIHSTQCNVQSRVHL